MRKFFKDGVFSVFKLGSLNSKGLTEIHAILVGKVCYVITVQFLLPWHAMVLSFAREAIKSFVYRTINIAFTIFHLFYFVGCIRRNI